MRRRTKIVMVGGGAMGLVLIATAMKLYLIYAISPMQVVRPAGSKAFTGDAAALLARGTERHGDTSLSTNGRSCNTCHADEFSYNETFDKPYLHYVRSVKLKTGLDTVTAEGMVQFCLISQLKTSPLAWDSETLAALTTFVLERNEKAIGR